MLRRNQIQLKTEEHLRKMRAAGLVVSRGLQAMSQAAKPGVTTGELNQIAIDVLAEHGAESNFLNYGAAWGYTPFPASVCASVNDTVVHGIPGDETLSDGDLISLDYGAVVDGWHGDACRTVIVGGPTSEANRKLNQVTEEALWAGIAAVKPGARIGDIGAAIQEAAGNYGIAREFTGHGIGDEMHMSPDVPNYGRAGRGPRIRPGMVICIEPIFIDGGEKLVELADGWTVKTADGAIAAHWENTVALTKNGLWILTEEDGGEAKLAELGLPFAPLS